MASRRFNLFTVLLAAFLSLFVLRAPAPVRAQTTPSEFVLFWRTNTTFESVAKSAYTLVFISFAYIPADNMFSIDLPAQCLESMSTLGVPPVRFNCKDGIATLKAANKKVGISIGGGDTVTSKVPRVFTTLFNLYVAGGNDIGVITRWCQAVVDFMNQWNIEALDFDNEEAHTDTTGGTADGHDVEALADKSGLDFMGLLQIGMRQALGPDKIFSVSLQPPFFGAPNIEDPGSFSPMKFPVRANAPWYNNYMYIIETNKAAYDSLTYMIWMYYPKNNMWEWVSNNDTLTQPILKYTLAPHDLNSTVDLAAVYLSQLSVKMAAGSVGSLNPKKMIVATQTNQPQQENAYIPGPEFYRQFAAIPDAQKPAGYGTWTEYLTWDPQGCALHDAVCQLGGLCPAGGTTGCPPNVQAFTPPANPSRPVQQYPAGTNTTGSSGTGTGTSTRATTAGGSNTGATSVAGNSKPGMSTRVSAPAVESFVALLVGVIGILGMGGL
ncbi:hypothetical protein M427DRAFT_29651 [Gonapodya prolifera JEL478]|uniref:Uncharacterized protein n=1 Tax=Gonapodya prolifera (strain JEL478) TaxID=1344416 RepID=A0A139APV0_GONPJ|nr:hypothetical protein M427DRAFT_29651 [Gonapodya prolifera JEL478]|eukprot:KXS18769.1 hypothetical protein M427DRAFT_29651 [Gonapodya prolifera JEL478]